ncbi:LAMI_0E13190g1_1 [Lachancea mirantina]|uniref:LAMI_0E13190g1_1 n=1 Tax=Lachancea mirantina TaxID=1230905 RepID=A0A1G4JQP1_9SACH|nr:LAMI_0E13190g1_1 [Lachancea mirantina]
MADEYGVLPQISAVLGSISFLTSFIAQIPQVLETYRDKTVEGLSPIFLLAWLFGDITTLIGALLTHQLAFQIILAVYFLVNDLFICAQYYYYGIIHENKLATPGHESKPTEHSLAQVRSRNSMSSETRSGHSGRSVPHGNWLSALFMFFSRARAAPLVRDASASILELRVQASAVPTTATSIGTALSWAGAMCYVCARVPQLIKNYHRKSTDGLSPFLFVNTLIANITYASSIYTSCEFLSDPDKWQFTLNELPFLIGSVGTIAFDLIYFYQHFVLYADDMRARALDSHPESQPLLD